MVLVFLFVSHYATLFFKWQEINLPQADSALPMMVININSLSVILSYRLFLLLSLLILPRRERQRAAGWACDSQPSSINHNYFFTEVKARTFPKILPATLLADQNGSYSD